MNAITQMKTKIALWMLSKLESKQKRCFMNLSQIRSLHILYLIDKPLNIDAQKQYNDLYAILDFCMAQKIKTEITLFVDKSLEEQKRFNIHILTAKDFSKWTWKPLDATYADFMELDCEVLLNLSPKTCYPLEYLAAMSNAKFKIANKREIQGAKYDFMIEMQGEQDTTKSMFDTVMFYLEKIQSK